MKMEQVSNSCYAVLNEKNRVCDANSGFVNVGGGIRLLTGEGYRIGSNVLYNSVSGEIAGDDSYFTWEIIQMSFDL